LVRPSAPAVATILMRKINWFVAVAVAVLVLTGLGAWTSVGTSTRINALDERDDGTLLRSYVPFGNLFMFRFVSLEKSPSRSVNS
jgi:hypothetical protein